MEGELSRGGSEPPPSSQFSVCACNELGRSGRKSLYLLYAAEGTIQLNTEAQGVGTQLRCRVFAWHM